MMACGLSSPVAIGTSAAAFSSGSKAALSLLRRERRAERSWAR